MLQLISHRRIVTPIIKHYQDNVLFPELTGAMHNISSNAEAYKVLKDSVRDRRDYVKHLQTAMTEGISPNRPHSTFLAEVVNLTFQGFTAMCTTALQIINEQAHTRGVNMMRSYISCNNNNRFTNNEITHFLDNIVVNNDCIQIPTSVIFDTIFDTDADGHVIQMYPGAGPMTATNADIVLTCR